ncbi:MAG: exo-alpha-sialidase [Phycisphaerae bacterium]|nr:exo-alpha-sialidase [Phycisphaerae bacterium]
MAGLAWSLGDDELLFNKGGTPTAIETVAEPAFDSKPVFDTIAGKIGSHAPTLTAFADGELLAAWYSYDGPGELDGAAIHTARHLPGRESWEPPEVLIDRPQAAGNPVLYSAEDAVWLFHAVVAGDGWSSARIEVQRSSDRGRTWSSPRVIEGPLGSNVRFPPVPTADGTLLLPAYDDLFQRALFFASTDGENWTCRSALPLNLLFPNLQPSVVVLDDGRLLAVMRNGGGGWLWVSASDDGGRSWTVPLDSGFPNPASPAALLRLADGSLILIYNDSNTARRPLSITISADEGVTWHPPRVLVDGDGAYAYPTAVQSPDGLIHVVYSHNRERIQHLILNVAWIVAGSPPAR